MPPLAFGFFLHAADTQQPLLMCPSFRKGHMLTLSQLLLNITQGAQSQPDHDLWPPQPTMHTHYSPRGELPPWPRPDPSFSPQAPLNCPGSAVVEMPVHRCNPFRPVHERLGGDTSTCLGPLCSLSSQQQCIKAFAECVPKCP